MKFSVVKSSSSTAVLTIVIVAVVAGQEEASIDSAVDRQGRGGMFGMYTTKVLQHSDCDVRNIP